MRTKGISHLALVISDMDRTVRFYTEILGGNIVGTQRNDNGPHSRHCLLDMGGGNLLALFDHPGGSTEHVGGMHHVALAVESLPELERIRSELIRKGIYVSQIGRAHV